MATVTILGSSSGMPGGERACSGYLIEHEGRLSLLDCGSGVARALQANGFSLTALDRVVISHTHPDHVSDLPLLIQHCHLSKKTTSLDVFVPSEFVEPLNQIIRAMYVIPERFKFEVRIQGYGNGTIIEQPMKIEAIANTHLQPYKVDVERLGLPNKLQSHSLRATIGDAAMMYSGDVGSFEDVRPHLGDCRLLILETSHVDTDKVREYAEGHSQLKIVLTHVTQGDFADQLKREFGDCSNVMVAEDGMRVEVG